jgi:hypothetical protein
MNFFILLKSFKLVNIYFLIFFNFKSMLKKGDIRFSHIILKLIEIFEKKKKPSLKNLYTSVNSMLLLF